MPIINAENLDLAFRGFKSIYSTAYLAAPSQAAKVAMTVPSSSRDESYGWLGQFPQLREWLDGERVVRQLKAHGFTIVNRKFESTVSVSRDDFSDDRLGVFKPMFAEMGHAAALHPDEIVFGLLAQGTTTLCFDGQNFFDTDHPVLDPDGAIVIDGETYSPVSNFDDGAGPTWYLLDTSRAVRPIIWQEREKYEFQNVNRLNDERVFMTDNFLYGIRARVNAGFGLWQLAHASREALNAANYAAIRAQMQTLTGDQGRPLGIRPNVLVVPPQLEEAAFHLLNTETQDGGGSNPWKGTAEIVVTPYLGG
ncbi:MAG: Mu-like prophage major head subunit gpT family protein [Paracoccus sp. (in: a-proteobacteria)]|uniref:Mu-like prophage major head subunit gpT family protein n=1 Tax=Paracoccus sp. TaxID=267 RepID=UPI000C5DE0A7|nr:Mu-like prophage major head subunit gpT family protein [Paracoccus sp. (in: a-proteobacteria)]MBA49552.1 hypothetical protein [Paracoccus sp. (in: a-proteobacteria)]